MNDAIMKFETTDVTTTPVSLVRTTMNWDQQQSLLLIHEFEKYELLWNPRDNAFHNTQRKEEAWKKMADSLNAEVGEVKRKVDSLRGSYRREKSRIKKAHEAASSGSGNGIYVSNWFAFEAMKFLDLNHDSYRTKDPLLDFFETSEEHDMKNSPAYYQTEFNPDPFVSPMDIARKRRASPDTFGQKSYKIIKPSFTTNKDECGIYGEYIAEKLRKLDQVTRSLSQHKINNVLFEIEMDFFKKRRYIEASASGVTDTLTFDNTLSPFQSSPKTECEFNEEDEI